MINFEEELKKFHPSLELEQAQEEIQGRNLDDVSDILVSLMGSTGQGEIGTHLDADGSFGTYVTAVDTRKGLIDKGAYFIVVITSQTCSVPELRIVSRDSSANGVVVELIGQVAAYNPLRSCKILFQVFSRVMLVDGRNNCVMYT